MVIGSQKITFRRVEWGSKRLAYKHLCSDRDWNPTPLYTLTVRRHGVNSHYSLCSFQYHFTVLWFFLNDPVKISLHEVYLNTPDIKKNHVGY